MKIIKTNGVILSKKIVSIFKLHKAESSVIGMSTIGQAILILKTILVIKF